MEITDETIAHVAELVKLEFDGERAAGIKADLLKILEYMDTMNALDTEGIMPMSHVLPLKNVFREDLVTNGGGGADLLENAPCTKEGKFVVPKTVG